MPLTFLNPALLLGMMAASLPVIIHFLSRRRRRRVVFSDLRFLQAAETRQARRRGIQQWLLLLLRVLIMCCLVLAAARPHWGGLPGGGGRAVLFVLDASASMQAQEPDGGTRFDAAVALAGEMLLRLPREASVHALLAGAAPKPLFASWLPAGRPARTALDAAEVLDGPSDLPGALREAARLVRRAPVFPCEVVLLSDLQAVPHADLEEAAAELAAAGARVLIRRMGDAVPGGGVLDISLPGRALRPGEQIELEAVVRPEREGQPFWLELGGRRVAEISATGPFEPGATRVLRFPLVVPEPGMHPGRVGKDPDRLPVDDARPFVLSVPGSLDILIAHGSDRDALGRGGWRYLEQALDPGSSGEGLMRIRTMPADSLDAADLTGSDLLVMVDAGALGRRLGGVLRDWLADGGALMLMVGDPSQGEDLRERLLPLLELPGRAEWRVRPADDAERVHVIDRGHPLLAGFAEQALQTLASARWQRYFAVSEGEARVILAGDAGSPLLLEGELGRGRWALLPFHLRRESTDFMINPLFLPLMQRLATRLVWNEEQSTSQEVGRSPVLRLRPQDLGPGSGSGRAGQLEVIVPPAGKAQPVSLTWRGATPVLVAPLSRKAGIYVFRSAGDTLGIVAAAVPVVESEPSVLDPEDLARRLHSAGLERVLDIGEAGEAGLERAMAGRDLARWLLGAGLLLMMVELWYGRRVRTETTPA